MLSHLIEELHQWCQTPIGQYLAEQELAVLSDIFAQCHGYYFCHMGPWPTTDYNKLSIKKRFILSKVPLPTRQQQVIANFKSLPLTDDSIDAIYMPHVLEMQPNPHYLLREVERVLIPGGSIILTSFNPWGLWGMTQMVNQWRQAPPWNGHFIKLNRIADWLALLGFETHIQKAVCFAPPFANRWLLNKMDFAAHPKIYSWVFGAASYIIWAKKKSIVINPVRANWQKPKKRITSGLIEPAGS